MHNIKEREREREFLFLTFYDINPRIMCKLQPGKKHVAGSREGGESKLYTDMLPALSVFSVYKYKTISFPIQ